MFIDKSKLIKDVFCSIWSDLRVKMLGFFLILRIFWWDLALS